MSVEPELQQQVGATIPTGAPQVHVPDLAVADTTPSVPLDLALDPGPHYSAAPGPAVEASAAAAPDVQTSEAELQEVREPIMKRKKRPKVQCPHCSDFVTNSNLARHIENMHIYCIACRMVHPVRINELLATCTVFKHFWDSTYVKI